MPVISRRAVWLLLTIGQGAIVPRLAAQTLTIATSPGTLTVSTATAGSQPDPSAPEATTSYAAVVPALSTKKIVAKLSSALPAGVTLTVHLTPTSGGATSSGDVILDVFDKDVVVNMGVGAHAGSITYTLSATVAATPFATTTYGVTFNLVNP
jgi:hypothetical protein